MSPRDNSKGDAPPPPRPTTSAFCRQKHTGRHQATRDCTPRRCREPFATGGDQWRGNSPVAKGSRHPQRHHPHQVQQLSIESTRSMSAKNYWQTLADTAELADMARLDSLPSQRRLLRNQVGQPLLANSALSADSADSQKPGVLVHSRPQFSIRANPRDSRSVPHLSTPSKSSTRQLPTADSISPLTLTP